jgi:hypothetical protein
MNELISLVKNLAPTVASALLGPLGGVAVGAIGKVFGIDGATIADVTKQLQDGKLSPDQLSQIKQLELQYQNDEKERGFKYSELEFADTKSAREMQISTNSKLPAILAVFVTLGFFGILSAMMFTNVPHSEPLLVMLGSLGTSWTMIIGFYFGSSHGSQQKDVLLANSTLMK